jgi:hypothetical protein
VSTLVRERHILKPAQLNAMARDRAENDCPQPACTSHRNGRHE